MIHEREIERNPITQQVVRYPWWDLSTIGDLLILYGAGLIPVTAREMAYKYARRRGWKVRTAVVYKENRRELHLTRVR